MTLDASTRFYTTTQQTLRKARDSGPGKEGDKLLAAGAGMVDSYQFLALPEEAQHDLLALYAHAMVAVKGGLTL